MGAQKTELQTTVAALALAWVAKNPNTSTVILGASKPEQLVENLKALEVLPTLTPEIMDKIEKILKSAPEPAVCIYFSAMRKWTEHLNRQAIVRKTYLRSLWKDLIFDSPTCLASCSSTCTGLHPRAMINRFCQLWNGWMAIVWPCKLTVEVWMASRILVLSAS